MSNLALVASHPTEPTTLIGHILTRYHEVHRRQLPELIRMAAKVQAVHASHEAAPTGLAALLTSMHTELLQHTEKEKSILFPMLERGSDPFVVYPIGVMRTEHEEHAERLHHLLALTRIATQPANACTTWQQLYTGVRKFVDDLQQHIRLENEVQFPLFEAQRSRRHAVAKQFPLNPAPPERIGWGCDRYCPVDDMVCGKGSVATLHPAELFGSDSASCLPARVMFGLRRLTSDSSIGHSQHTDDHASDGSGQSA